MSEENSTRKPAMISVPVRLPERLDEQIEEASRAIGLSKQDTMRLSLERGLKVLTSQLTSQAAA